MNIVTLAGLFFNDFEFVDLSDDGYWAGSFEKAFWVVHVGPGGRLGASRGGLEGVLGGSWGPPGATWVQLGSGSFAWGQKRPF